MRFAAHWGVCCHRLEPQFDSGDRLKSLQFPISSHEEHDSLDLKIQLAARRLAGEVADHFEEYWQAATPQIGGGYYPLWRPEDRLLDFSSNVQSMLRR
jgi:methionyl-tRNA formyltransferase